MNVSRRDFIKLSTSAAVAGGAMGAPAGETAPVLVAQAGQPMPMGFNPGDPSLKYDLVIAGGEVLDPSQNLRGKRDVGIKYGQIAAIAPGIPADRAVQRIDAGGKLVTPGLVDLHTHLCPHLGIGLPADELVNITAVTTAVSAGDAGAHTFGNFRHGVVPQSRTRLFGFVHIASIGLAGGLAPGEMLNIEYANVDGCAKVVAENPGVVLGVKVRITDSVVGTNGVEPLRRQVGDSVKGVQFDPPRADWFAAMGRRRAPPGFTTSAHRIITRGISSVSAISFISSPKTGQGMACGGQMGQPPALRWSSIWGTITDLLPRLRWTTAFTFMKATSCGSAMAPPPAPARSPTSPSQTSPAWPL